MLICLDLCVCVHKCIHLVVCFYVCILPTPSLPPGQCGEHGVAVPEAAAVCEGLHRVQLAAGGGAGSAVWPGAPRLGVSRAGARPHRCLLRRALPDRAGVASEGEHAGKRGPKSEP